MSTAIPDDASPRSPRRHRWAWLVVTAISVGLVACAGHDHGRDHDRALRHLSQRLELSDDQRAQLSPLLQSWSEQRDHHRAVRALLGRELGKDRFDAEAVHTRLTEETAAWLTDTRPLLDELARFHASLDAEQRQALTEELARERHQGRYR